MLGASSAIPWDRHGLFEASRRPLVAHTDFSAYILSPGEKKKEERVG